PTDRARAPLRFTRRQPCRHDGRCIAAQQDTPRLCPEVPTDDARRAGASTSCPSCPSVATSMPLCLWAGVVTSRCYEPGYQHAVRWTDLNRGIRARACGEAMSADGLGAVGATVAIGSNEGAIATVHASTTVRNEFSRMMTCPRRYSCGMFLQRDRHVLRDACRCATIASGPNPNAVARQAIKVITPGPEHRPEGRGKIPGE